MTCKTSSPGGNGRNGCAGAAAATDLDLGQPLQSDLSPESKLLERDELRLLRQAVVAILQQLLDPDLHLLLDAQRVDELKRDDAMAKE